MTDLEWQLAAGPEPRPDDLREAARVARELEEVIRWLAGQDHQEARALLGEERRVQDWALHRLEQRSCNEQACWDYGKGTKCCSNDVIASDQRERGNLAALACTITGLLRHFAPRNDPATNAFV